MVFLAAPGYVPPAPGPADLYVSAQHTWIGADGSEWDLSAGLSGLRLLAGVRGLRNPPHTRYSRKSPGRPGSQYAGSVTDERSVLWQLKVFRSGGSAAWIAHNDRFWQTMDRDAPGTWKVTQPGTDTQPAVMRWLKVRYDSLVDDTDDEDPGLVPWTTYGINLVADEDPLWRGEPIRRRFTAPSGQNFYGGSSGSGYGPPYYISSGQTTSSAAISNPGDEPTSPVLRVGGPTTNVRIGLAGHFVEFPMTLGEGETRQIDTDPGDQACYDQNGVDRTDELGAVDFFQVPKGTQVPLQISINGAGYAEVELTPGYWRSKGPAL